jgi:hypothetical protein
MSALRFAASITHTQASVWVDYLRQFLAETEPRH